MNSEMLLYMDDKPIRQTLSGESSQRRESRKLNWQTMPVSGIVFGVPNMTVFKRRDFARWQASERLPDAALCKAVQEMEAGLVDADLGGFL